MLKLVVFVGVVVAVCFAEEGVREKRSSGYDDHDHRGYGHEDSYGRDDRHDGYGGGYEKDYYKSR